MLGIKYILILFLFNSVIETKLHNAENPPENSTQKELQQCIYRNELYAPADFKLRAAYGCYCYNPDQRLNGNGIKLKNLCNRTNLSNGLRFDYEDEDMLEIIESLFARPEYFRKWKECAIDAVDCCKSMVEQNNNITELHCPMVWDGWSCIEPTAINTVTEVLCPNIAYSGQHHCQLFGTKQCLSDGNWHIYTNYVPCSVTLNGLRQVYIYQIILLAISIGAAIPCVIIFNCYYQLQEVRIRLHKNLIISIIVRNICEILSIYYIILNEFESSKGKNITQENGILCRSLVFLQELSFNWVFASMFLDGFYMYQLIVRTFDSNPPVRYYFFGLGGASLGVTIAWALTMSQTSNDSCWTVSHHRENWINNGFRLAMISSNFILLICIMKMLVRKLKRHSNVNHIRKASKATFILVPLFGLQFFFSSYQLPSDSCLYEKIWAYVGITFVGLPGLVVSLLYCFLNREVQRLLVSSFNEFRHSFQICNESKPRKANSIAMFSKSNQTGGSFVVISSNSIVNKTDQNVIDFKQDNNCQPYPSKEKISNERACKVPKDSDEVLHKFIESKVNLHV